MNETDWKILESRRSCALLSRDEMVGGRTPTTPTTASIIAGLQVQEAIKILHGMPSLAGEGVQYTGLLSEAYKVTYPRKPDCFGHDTYDSLEMTGLTTAETTVGAALDLARSRLGSDAVLDLSRDTVRALDCPNCGARREIFASFGTVTESDAACTECGSTCVPELLSTLGYDDDLRGRTLSEIGVPPYDVLTGRSADASTSFVFDGDAELLLGDQEGVSCRN